MNLADLLPRTSNSVMQPLACTYSPFFYESCIICNISSIMTKKKFLNREGKESGYSKNIIFDLVNLLLYVHFVSG